MQIPPSTGGNQIPDRKSLTLPKLANWPPQLSVTSMVPWSLRPQLKTVTAYAVVSGEVIVVGHDAFPPGETKQLTPARSMWRTGAVTNTPFTSTPPLPAPAGNTTNMKVSAAVTPLEVAATVIRHVPCAGLDQLVVAA